MRALLMLLVAVAVAHKTHVVLSLCAQLKLHFFQEKYADWKFMKCFRFHNLTYIFCQINCT
jgi:hypothetical protein